MKLSLEELTAYLKEYEKVRQVKVLDQINQMKQEEIQTKLEALSPVSACPSCNSNNFVKNGSRYGLQRYYCKNCKTTFSVTTGYYLDLGSVGQTRSNDCQQLFVGCYAGHFGKGL